MLGRTLGGRYRIDALLGEGGMGAVYAGVDLTSGGRVAVKVMLNEGTSFTRSQILRFDREARAASSVETEHIIKVLDFGHDAELGAPYMVLEHLTGRDVEQAVKIHGPLPIASALRIVAQAALGLARAHDRGIIHRDIKSANLYLHEPNPGLLRVKVLDFGIAKVLLEDVEGKGPEALTRTGTLLGSPLYMSPEQAQGLKSVDHRADIWSLGVVLHEALSGRTPFVRAESVAQAILFICTRKPEPVTVASPWVPAEVAGIVERCLRRDPEERFPSARALAAAIGDFLGSNDFSLKAEGLRPLTEAERVPLPQAALESTLAMTNGASSATPLASTPGTTTAPTSSTLPLAATAEQVSTATSIRQPRRPWVWAAVAAGALAVGAGGTMIAARSRASAPPSASSAPSAEAPRERSFRLAVGPPGVTADLDGRKLPVVDGAVIVTGLPGNTLRVRLKLGEHETVREVALTDQGPLPASISAELPTAIVVVPASAPQVASAPAPQKPPRARGSAVATPAASAAPVASAPPKTAADKLQQVFE